MTSVGLFGFPKPSAFSLYVCLPLIAGALTACGDPITGNADTDGGGSPTAPPPTGLSATKDLPNVVRLTWTPPATRQPARYLIQRDGADLATIAGTATSYEDTTTEPGTVSPPTDLEATQGTRPGGVYLTWKPAISLPGRPHSYAVIALYGQERSAPSERSTGMRGGPVITGNVIQRDGIDIATAPGDASGYDDTKATGGTMTPPASFAATQGTRSDAVVLTWGETTATPGPTHTYTVAALYDDQRTEPTNTATGSRGTPLLVGFAIERDGKLIKTVASSVRSYDDTGATGGTATPPASFTATKGTRADAVHLSWGESTASAGPPHTYTITSLYDDTRSVPSAPVIGSRGVPVIEGFLVKRDGKDVIQVPATQMAFDDEDATPGTVSAPESLTATQGTRGDAVGLSWTASTTTAGPSHTYTVAAVIDDSYGEAATDTGWRGPPTIDAYLVQRDGSDLMEVPGTQTFGDDTSATPGVMNPPASLTATQGSRADVVELSWPKAKGTPGPSFTYTVAALYSGLQSGWSNSATGWRGEPDIFDYVIRRDGSDLTAVPADQTSYADVEASPGTVTVPGSFAVTQGTRADGVRVTWAPATSTAGDVHIYEVYSRNDDTQSDPSVAVSGWRGAAAIVGYVLHRNGVDLPMFPPSTTSYDDTDVPKGQLFASITATQDPARGYVRLQIDEEPTFEPPAPTLYEIRAITSLGDGPRSDTLEGYRGMGDSITYQWQRSSDDDMSGYADLPGVTGPIWFDANAPFDTGRYFRAIMTAEGASGTTSEARIENHGFKAVSAGRNHTCGVRTDDKVLCWGSDSAGQAPTTPTDRAFLSVSSGGLHTCARLEDSEIVCWGDNSAGQAEPPPERISSVSAGGSHTCAVRSSDNKVICWGANEAGQAPTAPSSDAFDQVSAGAFHTCGIRSSDKKVVCWGDDTFGQAPSGPSVDSFDFVSAGGRHTCAVRASDHKVLCWGDNDKGQAPTGPSADTFTRVAAGSAHTCGLRTDGAIVCWGDNAEGQAPTTPRTGDFVDVSAGGAHSCGLRADQHAVCWGANDADQAPPWPVTDSFTNAGVGLDFSCAVRVDGKIVCWGDNAHGQAPLEPSTDDFQSVTTGNAHACGLRLDGTIACWGDNGAGQAPSSPSSESFKAVDAGADFTCGLRQDEKLVCWGNNALGQAPPGPSIEAFVAVSAGGAHACGVRKDNTIVCWGDNTYGQAPPGPSAETFKYVSAGARHTCAIRDDKKVVCWGDNAYGQAPAGPSADSFLSVHASDKHTCGIRDDGRIICWGDDTDGQAPAGPSLERFTSMATAERHSCGVRDDKKVICWGRNDLGQAPRP